MNLSKALYNVLNANKYIFNTCKIADALQISHSHTVTEVVSNCVMIESHRRRVDTMSKESFPKTVKQVSPLRFGGTNVKKLAVVWT